MIIAGVDAGGTATKCVLVNEQGEELARATAGPGNPQVEGFKQAAEAVKQAVTKACIEVGHEHINLLGIGMAGAGRNRDKKMLKQYLLPFALADDIYITDDGLIGLYGALAGQPGIVVTAGTGSIVYSLTPQGKLERFGGWGPLLGDEGSGFYFGYEALKAVIRSSENREEPTILSKLVRDRLEISDLFELIPFIYQEKLPRRKIAELAPGMLQAAAEGDKVASNIIERGIEQLVLQVVELGRKLGDDTLPVAVNGGLFKSEIYRNIFREKLKKFGNYYLQNPVYSADIGAVLYTCAEAGLELKLP